MDLKLGDIVAIILAIGIPVVLFTLLIVPGAMGAVLGFLLQEDRRAYIFFGGALLAFGVLAWRIYRRIRPAQRKKPEA